MMQSVASLVRAGVQNLPLSTACCVVTEGIVDVYSNRRNYSSSNIVDKDLPKRIRRSLSSLEHLRLDCSNGSSQIQCKKCNFGCFSSWGGVHIN